MQRESESGRPSQQRQCQSVAAAAGPRSEPRVLAHIGLKVVVERALVRGRHVIARDLDFHVMALLLVLLRVVLVVAVEAVLRKLEVGLPDRGHDLFPLLDRVHNLLLAVFAVQVVLVEQRHKHVRLVQLVNVLHLPIIATTDHFAREDADAVLRQCISHAPHPPLTLFLLPCRI